MNLKKEKNLLIVLTILISAFCIIFISNEIRENRNTSISQKLDDAYISVAAPHMKKNFQNKQTENDELNNKIHKLAFYKAKYKGIDYAVVYAEYPDEINLKSGAESIIKTLKYYSNFTYEMKNNEINGNKGILLEGTFEKDGIKYAFKEQLIKKLNILWQITAAYPDSKRNNTLAEKYINSINITRQM